MKEQTDFFEYAAKVGLLRSAGLIEISSRTFAVNTRGEAKGILKRYGLGAMLRVLWRMRLLYARSPSYRSFVKRIRKTGFIPDNLDAYFGYGLFVGLK